VAGAVIFLFGAEVSLPLLRILAGGSLAVWGALDATESFLRPGGRWWVMALRGVSLVAVGLAIVFVPKTVDLLAVLLGLALVVGPRRGSARAATSPRESRGSLRGQGPVSRM
jgi:hypothetical protein